MTNTEMTVTMGITSYFLLGKGGRGVLKAGLSLSVKLHSKEV